MFDATISSIQGTTHHLCMHSESGEWGYRPEGNPGFGWVPVESVARLRSLQGLTSLRAELAQVA